MIVFVDYKYKGIGGVGQLVTNIVLELNRNGYSAKVYASYDSYEYKRLVSEEADCVLINSDLVSTKKLSLYIDEKDVIFLTHLANNELLRDIRHLNNRIIFYVVHPDTFFSYHYFHKLFRYNKRSLELIKVLSKKNALCLMDQPNLDAIERRGLILERPIDFLPVPICANTNNKRDNGKIISRHNITYIGRGNDDWKIYPVIKVLQDLNKLEESVTFTICTDTDTRFKAFLSKYIPQNKIHINYKINLFGKDLDQYLINNSWLHISMGTSALEGAKLGIPTILIDYSKTLFPENYVYKWIYETEGFSLAEEIFPDTIVKGKPFNVILTELKNEKSYNRISEKCLDYITQNHSLDKFVDRIIKISNKTEMTTNDYCRSSIFGFYGHIYPIYKLYRSILFCVKHPIKSFKKILYVLRIIK